MKNSTKKGVSLICGANSDQFSGLAGKYVGAVKRCLGPAFSITYFSASFVNRNRVGLRHILQDGDTLEFCGVYGVKGAEDDPHHIQHARALVKYDQRLNEILSLVSAQQLDVEASVCLALSFARQHFTDTYGPINNRALDLLEGIATDIRRVADTLTPTPPQMVGSGYIAGKLGCSKAWITEIVRNEKLPSGCIVQGTGNGKPWKFYRREVDRWLERR